MAKTEVRPINHERLGRWKERLNENESTPVILVGVGHNKVKGRIMVLCTEERTDQEIVLFLHEALKQLTGYSPPKPTKIRDRGLATDAPKEKIQRAKAVYNNIQSNYLP